MERRLTIDEIVAREADRRSPKQRAADQHRQNVAIQLEGARRHLKNVQRFCDDPRAIRVAEARLAEAEAAARTVGVL